MVVQEYHTKVFAKFVDKPSALPDGATPCCPAQSAWFLKNSCTRFPGVWRR
jgi:hypothetical protein